MAILEKILGAGATLSSEAMVAIMVCLFLAYQATTITYNLLFHPLRAFPGPLTSRATPWTWAFLNATGRQAFYTQHLHDVYGPIVRIGPDHLSFTDARAWNDIYGHRVGSEKDKPEMAKTQTTSTPIRSLPTSILNEGREEHSKLRRALSHGFSDSSIRAQEPIITRYVDSFVKGLREHCQDELGRSRVVNLEAWFNWTTFDVVGDLVFGLSFGCLEKYEYHPWISFMLKAIPFGAMLTSMRYIHMGFMVELMFKTMGRYSIAKLRKFTDDMVISRLNMGKERNDLFEGMVKKQAEWKMPFENLSSNALILVLAGSETTATLLSGCTYLLLTHPDKMDKLKQEIRSTFQNDGEITASSTNKLTYMLAVLNEAMRLYPPVTSNLIRTVPAGGEYIADHFVAGGTMVECQHWSINHAKENWNEPWAFRPERFFEKDAQDSLDSLQPFSVGPRNCLGRNLAYVEMRFILARLVYNFDLSLADDSKAWIERQKAFSLWSRIPLNMTLTPASAQNGHRPGRRLDVVVE